MSRFGLAVCSACLVLAQAASGLAQDCTRLYLIPGTGADHRLFDALDLRAFDTVHVALPVPERTERMREYAARVGRQIDTTQPFSLLGVSLGGMVAVELADMLGPESVVIVASAKTRRELPTSYRLGGYVPVYKLIGGRTMRWTTKRLQPRMEPMDSVQQALFFTMMDAKDPAFLRGAVRLICSWEREEAPEGIVHVHGTLDHTLPYKFVDPTVVVEDAGHMLVYAQPEVVEGVLTEAVTAGGL